MDKQYSVLMSVYEGERPEYLHAALTSIIDQTVTPDEIILVCDGPLTAQLEQVVEKFQKDLTLVRLPENRGLGVALAEGIRYCRNEWIARMDSDDIAFRDRCERQLEFAAHHPEVDVLSGTVAEFVGDALTAEKASLHVISYKSLPAAHPEICKYIKYRNPINHPCVMFRKKKVMEVGNYQPCLLFEDYDLWARMYQRDSIFANLDESILYMRINNMYQRRGGIQYVKALIFFWSRMYRRGVITLPQYLFTMLLRVLVSLMPNRIRKMIYDKKLRDH